MAKVIVGGGSRGWKNLGAVRAYFIKQPPDTIVITGGAPGADTLIEKVCEELGLRCLVLEAQWHLHGRAAGPIRNEEMISLRPSEVVAFHWADSPGTRNLIKNAKAEGIPLKVVKNNG